MATGILNNADWVRSCEILQRGLEYTHEPLKASYTIAANPIRPGMVGGFINGQVELADQGKAGGAFFGLFLSEFSSELDESQNKTIPPVLVRGPATCKVLNAALGAGTFALDANDVVELVAVNGKLTPRGGETGPTVAYLHKVLPDGIEVQLREPSAA